MVLLRHGQRTGRQLTETFTQDRLTRMQRNALESTSMKSLQQNPTLKKQKHSLSGEFYVHEPLTKKKKFQQLQAALQIKTMMTLRNKGLLFLILMEKEPLGMWFLQQKKNTT